MKRLLVLAVLLSALAVGCTPAPQPPVGDSGGGSPSSNDTTVSNTTNG